MIGGSTSTIRTSLAGTGHYDWKGKELLLNEPQVHEEIRRSCAIVTDPWDELSSGSTGLFIWRIHRRRIVDFPPEEYGNFYGGDVFIVLKIANVNEETVFDIHLWVGKKASFADYQTGMYKVAELDKRLNFAAIIHRQADGFEAELFKTYFQQMAHWRHSYSESYRELRRNKSATYSAKLLHVFRQHATDSSYTIKEVAPLRKSIEPHGIYILDLGRQLIQWNGSLCRTEEVAGALKYLQSLKASRGGKTEVEMVDEKDGHDDDHSFYIYLSGHNYKAHAEAHAAKMAIRPTLNGHQTPRLLEVIARDGAKFEFSPVNKDEIEMFDINQLECCIYDTHAACFLWVSQRASEELKRRSLECIHNYTKEYLEYIEPFTILREGNVIAESIMTSVLRTSSLSSINSNTTSSNTTKM